MSGVMDWLAATGIVAIASGVQALTGFGFAVVAVPLLVLVQEPRDAVTACVILSVISTVGMWWYTRNQARLPIVRTLFVAALFGLPIGILALDRLEADWLRLGAGLATLAITYFVASAAYRQARPDASSRSAVNAGLSTETIVAGVASGLLTGCLSMPGPPVVALLSGRAQKTAYRATLLAYFALIYCVASLAMGAAGMIGQRDVAVGLTHIPALGIGAWLGDLLHRRIREGAFVGISFVLLACSGFACIVAAIMSLIASH